MGKRHLTAAALTLVFPLIGLAQETVPPEVLSVRVFPDRYVVAGRAFHDLAALDAWAGPIVIRALWLESCGDASAKPLMAAVERFHTRYTEGIRVRSAGMHEPGCQVAEAQRSINLLRRLPAGHEYHATDEDGRGRMP